VFFWNWVDRQSWQAQAWVYGLSDAAMIGIVIKALVDKRSLGLTFFIVGALVVFLSWRLVAVCVKKPPGE
jgi:hypothetical protein